MEDKNYVKGIFFKLPHENAPDFVKGSVSIKREDVIADLSSMTDEWINLDLKVSKEGKAYCSINTWKPDQTGSKGANIAENDASNIPF